MLEKETNLEKISSSLPAELAATYLATAFASAVSIGTISITPFLPVLINSLANQRFQKRVEQTFGEINLIFQEQEKKLEQLSDAQFKLINECSLAIFQTTDQEKLRYLKNAIKNTILTDERELSDSVFLSRAIRDISAEEANFLLKNFKYSNIKIGEVENYPDLDWLQIKDSKDKLICSGLISLGLLMQNSEIFFNQGVYNFSDLVAKLIVLLQD